MDQSEARAFLFGQAACITALLTAVANRQPDPAAFMSEVRQGAEALVRGLQYGEIERGSPEDVQLREQALVSVADVFVNIMPAA